MFVIPFNATSSVDITHFLEAISTSARRLLYVCERERDIL